MPATYSLTIRANGQPVFTGRESVHAAKCKAASIAGVIRIESNGALLAIRAPGLGRGDWREFI